MATSHTDPSLPFGQQLAYFDAGCPSPTSFYAPVSLDGLPTPCLSRRGSAGSSASADEATYGADSSMPQARLTFAQQSMLERQFNETPKPSLHTRRELAAATRLPVQRVANWFQNRRAKAKQQKKQEEAHTWKILESAGRRRAHEPSLSAHGSVTPPSLASPVPADSTMLRTPQQPRRSRSASDIATPAPPAAAAADDASARSRYASPSAASYASLARSLAVAAAAAAHAHAGLGQGTPALEVPAGFDMARKDSCTLGMMADGTQSPWPSSAFSDYGSSVASSVAYTPTPATRLDDPFEYDGAADRAFSSSPPSRGEPADMPPQAPMDDYFSFAQAIQMNQMSNTFTLASTPPLALRRRSNTPPQEPLAPTAPQFRDPFSAEVPQLQLPGDNRQPDSEMPDAGTAQMGLAARRRRPKLTPLISNATRSHSFMGPISSTSDMLTSRMSAPQLRRINSTGRIAKLATPRSPLYPNRLADGTILPDCPDTAVPLRPRTAGSVSSLRSVSQFVPQSEAPASPPHSGASPELPAPVNNHISPPPTPADSDSPSVTSELGPYISGDPAAIPRGFSEAIDFATYGMESMESMEAGLDDGSFGYDCFGGSSSVSATAGTSF